jgi:multiple sugar transport system permease protein
VLLAVLFMIPLLWLACSSLQPREQVGKVPPDWLPRQHTLTLPSGERLLVTPPEHVGADKLLVRFEDGPQRGQRALVEPERYRDGQVERELERVPVTIEQRVPARFVIVSEWFLSKYRAREPRTFYVPPEAVSTRVAPLWGNYPEAIRALSAAEKDKALPLGELIGKSSLPWTPKHDPARTITFVTYLANTLCVAALGVLGTVLSSALVAYGLSRIRWKGREALFALTLATMMIPFPVLMIPLYAVYRAFGWIGTLSPLWVPAFFGSAFNIFLLRQFFLTIPSELSDAARIDGCSELGIFWRVILPLARPALAVVALFHFLYVWNDFLAPLIFLTEPETFTMALGLQQYQSQHGGSEWHLLLAASVLLVLPIIVLFFLAQKTFIQGISTTGMGGR